MADPSTPPARRARRHARHARRAHRSRHLYLQIFRAFLGMVIGSVVITALIGRFVLSDAEREPPPFVRASAEQLADGLGQGEGLKEQLSERATRLHLEATLWAADDTLLARTGTAHSLPHDTSVAFHWGAGGKHSGAWIRLADGRSLAVSTRDALHPPRHLVHFAGMALVLIVLMGLLSLPIARRITRRLEHLRGGVERFGDGRLESRVEVVGHDEVAQLAQAFNSAAERIEGLVLQQKRMLASASHELRSPLARLRMAFELLADDDAPSPERRQALLRDAERDIAELDGLVADVLLAARLEQPPPVESLPDVDFASIVETEARRADVTAELLTECSLQGDAAMLARMVRNLIDNAHKHAGGAPVEVRLSRATDHWSLRVSDRGPGVEEAERARIFEPFYRPQGHAETRDGGVGLGLSLVRQIAERHGGLVRHLARDGGGSHFEVTFPVP